MTHETLNAFTYVAISEHLGAEVHTLALEAEDLAAHDGDALEAAKEHHGYNDADCIFSVEDARAAALYILEQTGFMQAMQQAIDELAGAPDAIKTLNAIRILENLKRGEF